MDCLFSGRFPKSAVFGELPARCRERLAPLGRVFRFEPGEVLVRQGEPNEWLHVITAGQVGLEREHSGSEHPLLLERLGPGELVGEYGLIDRRLAPCSARVMTMVETLRFQHLAIAYTLYRCQEVAPIFVDALERRLAAADERRERLVGDALQPVGWDRSPGATTIAASQRVSTALAACWGDHQDAPVNLREEG